MSMSARLVYSPLQASDVEALAVVLYDAAVYRFIGGLQSRAEFTQHLHRAITGPAAAHVGERWINHVVRLADTGEPIGRIEATVHHALAEVAFLFSPAVWGRGHATQGLMWLHEHLRHMGGVHALWATTHPENARSSALLRRCGYLPAAPQALPMLYSYDDGDLVFRRPLA
jgi:RimJ/RimL family protein N-acetyltransferase